MIFVLSTVYADKAVLSVGKQLMWQLPEGCFGLKSMLTVALLHKFVYVDMKCHNPKILLVTGDR